MLTKRGYHRLIELTVICGLFLCIPIVTALGGEKNKKTELLKEQIEEGEPVNVLPLREQDNCLNHLRTSCRPSGVSFLGIAGLSSDGCLFGRDANCTPRPCHHLMSLVGLSLGRLRSRIADFRFV